MKLQVGDSTGFVSFSWFTSTLKTLHLLFFSFLLRIKPLKTLYKIIYSSSYMHTNTQVQDFIDLISGPSSLYGLQPETLDSLVLSLLPPLTHSYKPLKEPRVINDSLDLKVLLMQELLQDLCLCAGFHIPLVSTTRLMAALLSLSYDWKAVSHTPPAVHFWWAASGHWLSVWHGAVWPGVWRFTPQPLSLFSCGGCCKNHGCAAQCTRSPGTVECWIGWSNAWFCNLHSLNTCVDLNLPQDQLP